MSEPARQMYDIAEAADALKDSASGLEATLTGLAGSKTLTIIGRLSSGILPGFWSIQNKIRAAFDYAEIYYGKEKKRSKEMIKSMKAFKTLAEQEAVFPKEMFEKDYFEKMESRDDLFPGLHSGSFQIFDNYNKMAEGLADFDLYEEMFLGKTAETDDERIYVLEEIKTLLSPQHQKMERRKEQIEKKRIFEMELRQELRAKGIKQEKGFRAFLIRKKKQIAETLKALPATLKKMGLMAVGFIKGFVTFVVLATLIGSIVKTAWPYLKGVGEVVMKMLAIVVDSLKFAAQGLGLIIEGIFEGNLLKTAEGLFKLFAGLLGAMFFLAISTVVLILGSLAATIGGPVVGFLRSLRNESLNGWNKLGKFFTMVGQILMVVGLIVALITYIATGAWMVGLAIAIAGALSKGIGSFLGKKATGGVVTKGMTLVGEQGPELVSLPAGSRVYSNQQSRNMTGNTTINVNVSGRVGASDAEIKDIANKVAREINLRMNRTATTGARF